MLAKGLPVDLHAGAFPPGTVVQGAIELIPALVHRPLRCGGDRFEIFVARSYAVSFWSWLTDAAAEFGYEVQAR